MARAELALTSNWSVKGEYSFADFDTADFKFEKARPGVSQQYRTCNLAACVPRNTIIPGTINTIEGRSASSEAQLHTIKVGLNYRF